MFSSGPKKAQYPSIPLLPRCTRHIAAQHMLAVVNVNHAHSSEFTGFNLALRSKTRAKPVEFVTGSISPRHARKGAGSVGYGLKRAKIG